MARKAAELTDRNRYARHVAASHAARMLRDHVDGVEAVRLMRVEAVDRRIFDDLVETRTDGSLHGWQIKRQTTPLSRDNLREIFGALHEQTDLAAGHLAFEDNISIPHIGELRNLRRLGDALRALGADEHAVCASANRAELAWLDFLEGIAGDRAQALHLARRVHIDVLGDEDQVRNRTVDALSAMYVPPLGPVAERLERFLEDADGTTAITPELLENQLLSFGRRPIRLTSPDRATRRRTILERTARRELEIDPILEVLGYELPPGLPAAVRIPVMLRGPSGARLPLGDWTSHAPTDRILISGVVGAGKSSLLRSYCHDLCEEALRDPSRPIPILLRVRDLVGRDPLEVAARAIGVAPELYQRLKDDPLTTWSLLLDGADEHPAGWHSIEQVMELFGDQCRS